MDDNFNKLHQEITLDVMRRLLEDAYEKNLVRKKLEWAILGIDANSPEAVDQAYRLWADHEKTIRQLTPNQSDDQLPWAKPEQTEPPPKNFWEKE